METAVTVDDLAKTYKRRGRAPVAALRGVRFDVRRGEVFGLLGPNGAGKTTVLKCLLGIVRPTRGSATVLGEPLGAEGYRRRIGYLPEGHQFPDHLTAAQVLEFTGAMRGTPKAECRARIPELLERVGMTPHADKKVREYSKGMKQRTGLAAALINRPELLFLDEPTDGVDPVGRRDIRVLIGELCKQQGLTVILNSHMLSEVEMVADRVAIMDGGDVKRVGSVNEILRAEELVSQRYRIRLTLPAGGAVTAEEVAPFGGEFQAIEGGLQLRVESVEALNRLIDHLRGRGALISAVQPERVTLEEVFMQLVGEGGNNGAGAGARQGNW